MIPQSFAFACNLNQVDAQTTAAETYETENFYSKLESPIDKISGREIVTVTVDFTTKLRKKKVLGGCCHFQVIEKK